MRDSIIIFSLGWISHVAAKQQFPFPGVSLQPFVNVFPARAECLSLSTDDPLQIHLTKKPLLEEYS